MTKIIRRTLVVVTMLLATLGVEAQRLAIKTNALDWLTLNGQVGIEARLNRHLTLDVGIAGNPFKVTVSGVRLNTMRFQPELRYWFNRPMARHFMGFSLLASNYNIKLRSRLYEGDMFAAGLTYGYALVLSKHWNMEFEAGVGVGRVNCFKYRENEDRPSSPNYKRWMPVPMKLSLSFCYVFQPSKKKQSNETEY